MAGAAGITIRGTDARALVDRIRPALPLLADISHADVLLLVWRGGEFEVVAHERPHPVPSVYSESATGRRIPRGAVVDHGGLLHGHRPRHQLSGLVVNGTPIVREVFPLRDDHRRTAALLVYDTAVIEDDRFRRRSALFRNAIHRIRDLAIDGRLVGAETLGRLQWYDGMMLVDADGEIRYVTAVAESLYRGLGYNENLVDNRLSDLETNEYAAFRAIELGVCVEQRVTEKDRIWIKKAIPLLGAERTGSWAERMRGLLGRSADGALIVIQDVTDEARKESEIRVKSAMVAEIHHRVKNNLQTIAGLLRIEARRSTNAEVASALTEAANRIISVASVHAFLSAGDAATINIYDVCNRILQDLSRGTLDQTKNVSLRLEGAREFVVPADAATTCALVVNELVLNSLEHGIGDREDGVVTVRLAQTDDSMIMEIEDNGQGLPPGFSAEAGGMGLGLVRTLVTESLRGEIKFESGRGTRVVVRFPRWRPGTDVGAREQEE